LSELCVKFLDGRLFVGTIPGIPELRAPEHDLMVEGAKGRLLPGIDTMTDGAALHEDDRVVAVFPRHRRRQAKHVSGLGLPSDGFEAHGGQVMTFIDDDMAVISHQIGDNPLPHQALHESDIDVAARLLFPAVDNTKLVRRDVQKRLETRQPLIEKLPTMDKDQRIPAPHGYHLGGDDGLAESRGCCEHPDFMIKKACRRFILLRRQLTEKPCPDRPSLLAFVAQFGSMSAAI
jgi:hypothetical protein